MNLEHSTCGEYEMAGKMMEEHDRKDFVSIETKLGSQSAYSGLSDFDYQDLSNLTDGRIKDLQQLKVLNKVPIPNEIMEHFKNIKCHCRMGLFPEIGRAWLTIDSDIYIWTYEYARDVAYFDGLGQLIVSVGLVKPKPSVFINDVKYLLVLTTPVEIIVLGVTFGDTTKQISTPSRSFKSSTYEEMQLMNKPIFVVNTDNILISCVEGTADGRIFLGGRDGCLYEITYQAESNWFGKRCKKVNHSQGLMSLVVPGFFKVFSENDGYNKMIVDNQRQILYALSEKGAIEVWDIGDNSARRITRISQSEISNSASNLIKTVDSSIFKPVVDICVLASSDYQMLCLVAVTQSGVRLYFGSSYSNLQPMPDNQSQFKLQGLGLHHVRLPPGYTPNATYGKPKNVHSTFNIGGSILMVSSPQADQDLLWSISSDPFLHTELTPMNESMRRLLAESSTTVHLDGQVWAIAEVKDKTSGTLDFPKDAKMSKKVVLLTTQGALILELLKPIDLLQQILLACHGAHHEAVKTFFEVYSEPESCATSLMLANHETYAETEISSWATQAFFRYGGEPFFISQQHIMQQQQMQGQHEAPKIFMSTPYAQTRPASAIQQNLMNQTQFANNSTFQSSMPNDMFNLKFSAKHGALYLHTARILRPIWNRKCIDSKLSSTISIQDCNELLRDLYALRAFLEANSVSGMRSMTENIATAYNSFGHSNASIVNGFSGNPLPAQQQKRDEALFEEKKSLDALVSFMKYVCEIINLWKILCEHQLHLLVTSLSMEHRQMIENCNFRDVILSRNDLCAVLILTIVNSYLSDNASVKSISEKLREVCPTLYRNEDAISHKATEILKLSKSCANDDERIENLLKALELCCQAAPKLPLSNICQQFTAAGFFEGVIKLCITFAAKLDPNDSAIHFYKNNYPVDITQIQAKNQEEFVAFTTRMKCYDEVKNMLQHVFTNINQLGDQIGNLQLHQVLNVALSTQDHLLHVAVYEWMLQNSLFVEILKIGNTSLGDFLSRSVNQSPINFDLADLLWKYYEKNGQHHSAAKILDKLATMTTESITLSKRIEYLARAVMSMRSDSIGYAVHHGEFLKDLEDKLDIAQVQKQIFDALCSGASNNSNDSVQVRDAIKALNSRLFDMSQLYSDFAESFNLWECQLSILNCSHHNEPRLINSVWSQILDNELHGASKINEKPQRLLSKVQSLANEFGVGPCFPLGFIIEQLELRCFELGVNNSPVPDALMTMNLDIDQVLDSYNKILTSNDRVWLSGSNELYLIESAKKLLYLITQNNFATNKNRRRTIAKTEDLISATLTALYTKQSTVQTKRITEELRQIRENLSYFN